MKSSVQSTFWIFGLSCRTRLPNANMIVGHKHDSRAGKIQALRLKTQLQHYECIMEILQYIKPIPGIQQQQWQVASHNHQSHVVGMFQ